ncbi:hypothetical protein SFRURICE_018096 [Spodoptera frugiperda]|nr:hypothetical protein SFRURICE_018096 [Spodoptera frugiperda]
MNEPYHVVPWFNSEEWHSVYNDLENSSANKEKLLERLLIWKARSPSLPSGIESTLSLLQVYVEDKKSEDGSSDQLLRLAYSSAIMRFVNHMLDTVTVKGSSLYQAARTLGVPDWVVDLRHDTAHSNTLPPLKLLRDGCLVSLQWLLLNYWDKLKPYIQDYVCGQEDPVTGDLYKIEALFNFYISLGICTQTKLKMKNLSEIPNAKMRDTIVSNAIELLQDQVDLSNLKTVSINSLINTLNLEGKKLLKVKEPSAAVNEILLGNESLLLSKELVYFFGASDFKYKNKLCSSYVKCFEMLLSFLHTNDLLLELILGLIKITQTQESGHFKSKLSALWLSEILAALKISQNIDIKMRKMSFDDKTSKKRKDLKRLYEHWYPGSSIKDRFLLDLHKSVPEELQDISYINPIITAYNNYLTYFIHDLLDLLEPNLPTMVSQKICTLAKLISTPEKFPVTTTSVIYTVDDLEESDDVMIVENTEEEECRKEDTGSRPGVQSEINSIWKLAAKEFDWSTCPIGKLPFQNKETEVEMETN